MRTWIFVVWMENSSTKPMEESSNIAKSKLKRIRLISDNLLSATMSVLKSLQQYKLSIHVWKKKMQFALQLIADFKNAFKKWWTIWKILCVWKNPSDSVCSTIMLKTSVYQWLRIICLLMITEVWWTKIVISKKMLVLGMKSKFSVTISFVTLCSSRKISRNRWEITKFSVKTNMLTIWLIFDSKMKSTILLLSQI